MVAGERRERKKTPPLCLGQLGYQGAFYCSWGPEGEPRMRKGFINSEYFLRPYQAAGTLPNLVFTSTISYVILRTR